ncbi:SdrD B-like domain-containing protein [Methanoculleus sp.]|uniref:SdrD B-like domain-containing protein n=1 Tax=Methanoculleus sp. TaxID=90427 RepID=UPI001BD2CA0F|nr:SdrD B-like domain-containing protein [Methanoculleus sp.]
MRRISVLVAIIASAFVFGSIASAAVPAEPGPGTGYEKTVGTIGGTVFLDADANGVQDSGEWGLSGVAVHLLDAAGERIATAETFSHACEGLYIFSGILPGNYTVEVVPPEGYAFTVPGGGAPGETASTVDAVNGTTTPINLTEEVIEATDLVVRDAGLVPAED